MEPPDRLEKGIRFGCGSLFGCLFTVAGGLTYSLWNMHYLVATCIVVALLCGYGAMKFGDRFWTKFGWLWTPSSWWGPWW